MVTLNFDASQVEPQADFEPLPSGTYTVAITASELKTTKAGTGSYLKLEYTVLEGECKGRKVWENLNLNNPNQQAVEIARRTLSSICRAVNVIQCRDSSQLHNIPFSIRVAVKHDANSDSYNNEVKSHEPRQPVVTTLPTPTNPVPNQFQSADASVQASVATSPWQRSQQ